MPADDFIRRPLTLSGVGGMLNDLTTPSLRLGVTGLARSGKTVFITSLIRNLVREARLPFFLASSEGRIIRAFLQPQPDDDVPRFAYEEHLAALGREPPEWPVSTRRVSELRVAVEYRSQHPLWRQLGVRRLNIDIVDYPGEWLIDLPLLTQSYAEWSRAAMQAAENPARRVAAAPFLAFSRGIGGTSDAAEQIAIKGAGIFTRYLREERSSGAFEPTLGPGRFLLPGELEGSPLLTFMPLPEGAVRGEHGDLEAMMERRFEAYKLHVVKPFYRDHFARLDRQVVLVDTLSAIDRGAGALRDLEATLSSVLACFKIGSRGLLSGLLPRKIDRILLAATKADHVPQSSHDRLQAILGGLTVRAMETARFTGAETRALALAALRSTQQAELKRGDRGGHVVGIPLSGERIGEETFDGRRKVALYPGDLPETLDAALERPALEGREKEMALVRFRPHRIAPDSGTGAAAPWPHIRMDRALEFLIGDWLA